MIELKILILYSMRVADMKKGSLMRTECLLMKEDLIMMGMELCLQDLESVSCCIIVSLSYKN